MCFVLTVSTYIALNALHALILCLDSVDIHKTQCIAPFDPLYQPSGHENEEATVSFNAHTHTHTQDDTEWLLYYLIQSRYKSISKS